MSLHFFKQIKAKIFKDSKNQAFKRQKNEKTFKLVLRVLTPP